MSYKVLETKIVNLLPSHTLREYVKKHKYHFTQMDLLKFVEDYAPTYDEKIKLLNEIATTFSDKSVVNHANKLILYHQRTLVKSVAMPSNDHYLGTCDGFCVLCKKDCLDKHRPHFPKFLQQYDLVAYKTNMTNETTDRRDEQIVYGIITTDMNICDDDTHVVLLENKYIHERNAFYQNYDGVYQVYNAHDHPSYAVLFKPDISQLDESILADYEYAVKVLKELYAELE